MKSLFEQFGGTYRKENDYVIPNLEMPDIANIVIFFYFVLFGNLFPAFTFFLNVFHPAFGDDFLHAQSAGCGSTFGMPHTWVNM